MLWYGLVRQANSEVLQRHQWEFLRCWPEFYLAFFILNPVNISQAKCWQRHIGWDQNQMMLIPFLLTGSEIMRYTGCQTDWRKEKCHFEKHQKHKRGGTVCMCLKQFPGTLTLLPLVTFQGVETVGCCWLHNWSHVDWVLYFNGGATEFWWWWWWW